MKRSGLPHGQFNFGDHFFVRRDAKGIYQIYTSRGRVDDVATIERRSVEDGFASEGEARERSVALALSPRSRRARFRYVKGGR